MKVLTWLGPRQMQVEEAAMPVAGAGEVVVAVERVGICGSEIEGYLGNNSLRVPPLVMGHEFAGHVATRGEGVQEAWQGAHVAVNPLLTCGACSSCLRGRPHLCRSRRIIGVHRPGGFGQYVAVPDTALVHVTDSLRPEAAALAEPTAVAVRALRHAGVALGNTVVVVGCGSLGVLLTRLCTLAGVRVIALDTARARRALARCQGAAETVDAGREDAVDQVTALAGERGVDAVFDLVGHSDTRRLAIGAVRPGGRVVMVGLHDAESRLALNDLVRWEISVTGSFAYTPMDFADATRLLVDGQVTGQGWTRVAPMDEGPAWFARLVDGQVDEAKVLLAP